MDLIANNSNLAISNKLMRINAYHDRDIRIPLIYLSYHNFTNGCSSIDIPHDIFYLDSNRIYISSSLNNIMYLCMSGIRGNMGKTSKYLIYIGYDGLKMLDLPKYVIYLAGCWHPHYTGNTQNVMYATHSREHSMCPQYLVYDGESNIYRKNK